MAFTSVGHFINDGTVFFVPLLVDLLATTKGTTPLQVSILLVLFYLISTASSVFVGRYADRSGRAGELMALGVACLSLGLLASYAVFVLSTAAYTFAFSMVCIAIMGFGSSFYHPLGGTILQSSFGRATAGRALGFNGAMGSLGRALYPSLFFALVAVSTAPDSLAFFGLLGVGAAAIVWKGLRGRGISRVQRDSVESSVRSTLTKPMVILLAVSFLRQASLFGVVSYIPIFLTTQRGLGVSASLGLSLTALYVSAIFGQPFFGFLTERLDRRLVLAISAAGASASIVGYVHSSGVASVPLLSLFGFFAYTGFPVLLSLASDYGTQGASSFGNSLIWGIGATGGDAAGPLIIYAATMNQYGRLDHAFELMATLAAVSAIASLMMPRSKARRVLAME